MALNRKLFFFGSYPADETYRIWISVFIAATLMAVTYGVWAGRLRPYLITIGVVAIIILTFGLGAGVSIEESQYTEQIVSVGKTTTVQWHRARVGSGARLGAVVAVRLLARIGGPLRDVLAANGGGVWHADIGCLGRH